MGGIFSAPKLPPAPPDPAPPPDPEAEERKRRLERLERQRRGRSGLVSTSQRGFLDQTDIAGERNSLAASTETGTVKTKLGE